MHQIWLNRNLRKHEGTVQNTQASINLINRYFCTYIRKYYDTYLAGGNLKLFEQCFCQTVRL